MKKAFTLIELMIVIAVLAILMGIVFRLSSTGSDSGRRSETIARLQRLENCLSGYNAAFGSYPPVKLHGTRDIYMGVGASGIQTDQRNEGIWGWNPDTFRRGTYQEAEYRAWKQVEAACRSQPVDCKFPFPQEAAYINYIDNFSREIARRAQSGDEQYKKYYRTESLRRKLTSGFDALARNANRLSSSRNETDWRNIQLYKFGLMSYLLPRYLIMMNGDEDFCDYAQWTGNNTMPSDPMTGRNYASNGGWRQLRRYATSDRQSDIAKISSMPSQAVCARWMPNLAGICRANHSFRLFGIDIKSGDGNALDMENPDSLEVFSAGDPGASNFKDPYVLDSVSVLDGWDNEFYYYSPYPHQKYVLWSAGPNGRTFPPWISRKRLQSNANKCAAAWTEDDIVQMSN